FVPRAAGESSGHLLFVKDNSLRAVSFDAKRLQVSGEPTVLATGVDQANSRGAFSASANGLLAYWAGSRFVAPELNWYDRSGKIQERIPESSIPPGHLSGLSLSLNMQRVAAGISSTLGGTNQVWVYDLARGGAKPVLLERNSAIAPVWSPDSKRLPFDYSEAGALTPFVYPLDQAGSPERLLTTTSSAWPTDWSQDDRLLIYSADHDGRYDIWALSLTDKKAHAWLQGPASNFQGQLAPGVASPW